MFVLGGPGFSYFQTIRAKLITFFLGRPRKNLILMLNIILESFGEIYFRNLQA